MPTKILLDTDIGSDIDDAVCLAYLLAQKECELLGITTVTGEARQRAMMASCLCMAAGRDVPIFPGAEVPLLVAQAQTAAPQAAMVGKWEHQAEFPGGQAVEFMRRTIRDHPGEVTLLTIGPLTNVALLFSVDPEIPAILKGIVSMAGVYTNRYTGLPPVEWNVTLDPHAAAIVFRAPVTSHRILGLDVTHRVTMERDEVRGRFAHPLLSVVADFAEVWFAERPVITFHDPMAGALIFDESPVTFERGTIIDVETRSDWVKGMCFWLPDPAGRHEVGVAVDAGRFFDHYFSVFT
jgi:purine nucleosidase